MTTKDRLISYLKESEIHIERLKDVLGAKIFRNYLELLKELNKENIVDIDKWAGFKAVRNSIAHDYLYKLKR